VNSHDHAWSRACGAFRIRLDLSGVAADADRAPSRRRDILTVTGLAGGRRSTLKTPDARPDAARVTAHRDSSVTTCQDPATRAPLTCTERTLQHRTDNHNDAQSHPQAQ
jgi:hypothetical protein